MTEQLPSWPTTPPSYGFVVLREFTEKDAHLAIELGDDLYIPSSQPARTPHTPSPRWLPATLAPAAPPSATAASSTRPAAAPAAAPAEWLAWAALR